jgi:hypothetical protein
MNFLIAALAPVFITSPITKKPVEVPTAVVNKCQSIMEFDVRSENKTELEDLRTLDCYYMNMGHYSLPMDL